jgi:hypothetical protein
MNKLKEQFPTILLTLATTSLAGWLYVNLANAYLPPVV